MLAPLLQLGAELLLQLVHLPLFSNEEVMALNKNPFQILHLNQLKLDTNWMIIYFYQLNKAKF